jgi:hypothetical protein
MNRLKVTVRKGARSRHLRLTLADTAIVFHLSNGNRIEVDLAESSTGNLVLRSHQGAVRISDTPGSFEVNAATTTD